MRHQLSLYLSSIPDKHTMNLVQNTKTYFFHFMKYNNKIDFIKSEAKIFIKIYQLLTFTLKVKPVNKDHPKDRQILVFINKQSLLFLRFPSFIYSMNGYHNVAFTVIIVQWSLNTGLTVYRNLLCDSNKFDCIFMHVTLLI